MVEIDGNYNDVNGETPTIDIGAWKPKTPDLDIGGTNTHVMFEVKVQRP